MKSTALIIYWQFYMISRAVSYQYVADFFAQLSKATRNQSIFESFKLKHSHHSAYSIGALTFKFDDDLVDFLERLNSTFIGFRLLNFTNSRVPLFQTRLPLFLNVTHTR